MRLVPLLLAFIVALPCMAHAQRKPAAKPPPTTGPKALGTFEDWVAATHEEGGQPTCYAFVRAANSVPALAGRGEVVLTVTERQSGRDAVAITAGYNYPRGATVTMQVDNTGLDFYTAQNSAFARDGRAAVAAFQRGTQALARSSGPREGQTVVDTFSLRGFSAAYAAISKACPAR